MKHIFSIILSGFILASIQSAYAQEPTTSITVGVGETQTVYFGSSTYGWSLQGYSPLVTYSMINGNSGTITGVQEGSAQLTFQARDGATSTIWVTVSSTGSSSRRKHHKRHKHQQQQQQQQWGQ